MAGRRGQAACPRPLELTETTFTNCVVDSGVGAGGAVAVFDATVVISDCFFQASQGTAVLFESSSAEGTHKLDVSARVCFLQPVPDGSNLFTRGGEGGGCSDSGSTKRLTQDAHVFAPP